MFLFYESKCFMIVGWCTCSKDAAGLKRDCADDRKTDDDKRQTVPTIDVTAAGLQKVLYYRVAAAPDEGYVMWISPDGDKEIMEGLKDHGLIHIILIYDQHVHSIMLKMNVIWKCETLLVCTVLFLTHAPHGDTNLKANTS